MADLHAVFDRDAFAEKAVALDFAALADTYPTLHFHKGSKLGFIADGAAVEVYKVTDDDILSKDDVRGDAFVA